MLFFVTIRHYTLSPMRVNITELKDTVYINFKLRICKNEHKVRLQTISLIIHIFKISKGVFDVNNEQILTPEEVAQILKLSKNTVYKLLRNKQIPAIKIQHQYRILESELYEWLRSNIDSEIVLD